MSLLNSWNSVDSPERRAKKMAVVLAERLIAQTCDRNRFGGSASRVVAGFFKLNYACKTMLKYTSSTLDMTPHRLYHASCVERGEIKSITSSHVQRSDQSGSTYRTTFRTFQVCVSSAMSAPTALNVEKSKQF